GPPRQHRPYRARPGLPLLRAPGGHRLGRSGILDLDSFTTAERRHNPSAPALVPHATTELSGCAACRRSWVGPVSIVPARLECGYRLGAWLTITFRVLGSLRLPRRS